MKNVIYLDYAAATPLNEEVFWAMQPYFTESFYNPSATYMAAQRVSHDLEQVRAGVAHWLGARPSEIIFTAGGTEANNLAIDGIMRQYPDGNIVVSAIEHESVLAPARQYDCREVGVSPNGMIDLEVLAAAIDENTVLVSVMYANNEVGTIQPIRDIATIIEQKRAARAKKRIMEYGLSNTDEKTPQIQNPKSKIFPLYLHTDACQAANSLDLHASRLGVDMLTLNGGKIYGPKQSGALYVSSKVNLQPIIRGGGQERNLRSGTENVTASIGFATALKVAQEFRHDEVARLQTLQTDFIKQLEQAIPNIVVNGSLKKRLPNNVHITIPGQDNERVLVLLDEAGVLAAAGSACSASDDEPSHVLRAMGISDADARASLRFTMGRQTEAEDLERVIKTLVDICKIS